MRRGPGSKDKNPYAAGIHQDYGLTEQDFKDTLYTVGTKSQADQYQKMWDKPIIQQMKGIVFWRPILMKNPLKSNPLCMLDPNTVKRSDIVTSQAECFTKSPVPLRGSKVKYNPDHRWYYFPDMTVNETIVFTQFDQRKGVDNTLEDAQILTNFHTAFKDPTAPTEGLEPRMSCEHRVRLWMKKKGDVDASAQQACCETF